MMKSGQEFVLQVADEPMMSGGADNFASSMISLTSMDDNVEGSEGSSMMEPESKAMKREESEHDALAEDEYHGFVMFERNDTMNSINFDAPRRVSRGGRRPKPLSAEEQQEQQDAEEEFATWMAERSDTADSLDLDEPKRSSFQRKDGALSGRPDLPPRRVSRGGKRPDRKLKDEEEA